MQLHEKRNTCAWIAMQVSDISRVTSHALLDAPRGSKTDNPLRVRKRPVLLLWAIEEMDTGGIDGCQRPQRTPADDKGDWWLYQ